MSEREPPEERVHSGAHVHGPEVESPRTALLSRPVLAVVTLLALLGATEVIPSLSRFSPLRRAARTEPANATAPTSLDLGEAELETETRSAAELPTGETRGRDRGRGPIAHAPDRAGDVARIDEKAPPVLLEDASGSALTGFYRALLKTARKEPGALTRVTHFGDSIVVSDYVSSTLRRRLQTQFGDGGHGFSLLANAWPGYAHQDVYRFASRGWRVSRVVGPLAADGSYGLGGVSFRASPGARSRFGTAKKGDFGRRVSRFVVYYLEQPNGGSFQVNMDGAPRAVVSSHAERAASAVHELRVPDGEHELEIVTRTGEFRGFGVVMEREGPGVVLDAIGIQGARIRFLDKQDDAHWAEQLKLRAPHLLVYQFGANESSDGFAYPMPAYLATMKAVLAQGKRALPDAGCLVIGAMDRAHKPDTELVSLPVIPKLVERQRRAAAEEGCAFFDTYRAMGGSGSMASWVRRGLGQADMTHPSGVGSEIVGTWIFRALMHGFNAFVTAQR
jgi:hypothetical protein